MCQDLINKIFNIPNPVAATKAAVSQANFTGKTSGATVKASEATPGLRRAGVSGDEDEPKRKGKRGAVPGLGL